MLWKRCGVANHRTSECVGYDEHSQQMTNAKGGDGEIGCVGHWIRGSGTYSNAALDIKVLVVVNAQLLRGELLQPVRILGLGRPGVFLLQASSLHLGLKLLPLGVNAGRRGVEQALDLGDPAGLHHVEGDHRVIVHDDRVIALDESHTTHVGGEVEHMVATLDDLRAVLEQAQIDQHKLVAEDVLRHVLIALPIAGNDVVALALQPLGKMTACRGGW